MRESMFVKVIAASRHPEESVNPIITIHARYPRFIHAEAKTHRAFSTNSRSSRAVPIWKVIEEVETNPVIPWHWGKNQPGMQAAGECNEHVIYQDFNEYGACERITKREIAWEDASDQAVRIARGFMKAGYHKQVVNRLLEPFMWIDTLITATEWDNFFELRCHKDAEPHFQDLANMIREAIENAEYQQLKIGDWHLPYITAEDKAEHDTDTLLKLSAARCARVSYVPFDGNSNVEREIERFNKLITSKPIHASPIEHQARATAFAQMDYSFHGNFDWGWYQFRKAVEGHSEGGLGKSCPRSLNL